MTPPVLTARCTLVVAAPGYGKTTRVRDWLTGVEAVWLPGPSVLSDPSDWVSAFDTTDWLIVDDLPAVSAPRWRDLIAGVRRMPVGKHVVLISRHPAPPVADLWRRDGTLAEYGPPELALTPSQTMCLLRRDGVAPPLADLVYELTAGWPILTRLAGRRLRAIPVGRRPATVKALTASLTAPGSPIVAYLDQEVFGPLRPAVQRVVRVLARLPWADEELLRALGPGHRATVLTALARLGLVVPAQSAMIGGAGVDQRRQRLVPLLARIVRQRWPLSSEKLRRLHGATGAWYASHGWLAEAVSGYQAAGDTNAAADLLRVHGPTWVLSGGARAIAATVPALPPARRCRRLRILLGEALLVLGDGDAALDVLGELADEIGATQPLSPEIAWRLGVVHYLRADPYGAAEIFRRGRLDGEDTVDEAMLLSWDAAARWMVGDLDGLDETARRALRAATRAGSARAKAAAHVSLALHAALAGDRAGKAMHYDAALRFAEHASDWIQAARIRTNRSSQFLEEARYVPAAAEARAAGALAEATGYTVALGVALTNEGLALTRLGELEQASRCFDRALTIFQGKASGNMAYPLTGLGGIHRLRGRYELARAAYEEAVRSATNGGNLQALVPALTGLARLVVDRDVTTAAGLAERALSAASGPTRTAALLAAGWVAVVAGHPERAAAMAGAAAEVARLHRDRAGLAEALELRAVIATEPAEARRVWQEAGETWRITGARLDVDRVATALSRLPVANATDRIEARLACERLDAAGVRQEYRPGACVPDVGAGPQPVAVRSLGRFEVTLGGVAVPASAWRSRKARDLLRILVGRRGRPMPRGELAFRLWGDGDPDRLAHRLSVALSTLRLVLDPERRAPADHFVLADQAAVALDTNELSVDLELFESEAAHGLRLRDRGECEDARIMLVRAERRYAGEFLEDEPYEDWSVAVREEARATYLRVIRELAQINRQAGRIDEAVHYLLKVLGKDAYDEQGHRDLVDLLQAAGRYGEARRAWTRYVAAMREIEMPVPPRPADCRRADRIWT